MKFVAWCIIVELDGVKEYWRKGNYAQPPGWSKSFSPLCLYQNERHVNRLLAGSGSKYFPSPREIATNWGSAPTKHRVTIRIEK